MSHDVQALLFSCKTPAACDYMCKQFIAYTRVVPLCLSVALYVLG